jgi:hypothetical protein
MPTAPVAVLLPPQHQAETAQFLLLPVLLALLLMLLLLGQTLLLPAGLLTTR